MNDLVTQINIHNTSLKQPKINICCSLFRLFNINTIKLGLFDVNILIEMYNEVFIEE